MDVRRTDSRSRGSAGDRSRAQAGNAESKPTPIRSRRRRAYHCLSNPFRGTFQRFPATRATEPGRRCRRTWAADHLIRGSIRLIGNSRRLAQISGRRDWAEQFPTDPATLELELMNHPAGLVVEEQRVVM